MGMNIPSGCGCGSTAATKPSTSTTTTTGFIAPAAGFDPSQLSLVTTPRGNTGGGGGAGDAAGVRDPAAAQRNLGVIKQSLARFTDIRQAVAAGYRYNPDGGSEGGLQHWINPAVFSTGDPSNVGLPATLMYQLDSAGRASLAGAMISVDPKRHAVPDYGAGAWHTHPDDPQLNMHVWLDGRGIEQGAFENNAGMV